MMDELEQLRQENAALRAQLDAGGKCECGEKDVCRIVARRLAVDDLLGRAINLLSSYSFRSGVAISGMDELFDEYRSLGKH
jgi:hypothetical protein